MASIERIMSKVRMQLDEPRPNQPSMRLVLDRTLRSVQSMINRLSNTDKAWATGETQLDVVPQQEEYPLSVDTSFGKPLAVSVIQPGNPGLVPRYVEMFEVQNMYFDWGLPNNVASWCWQADGSPNTAMRIAIFRKEGIADNIYVRILPIPMLAASYTILYTIGNWIDSAALTTSPVLTEHHDLVAVTTAMSLLPSAKWWDDEDENVRHREELARSLRFDLDELRPDFDRYIGSMTVAKMQMRHSFGGLF